MKRMQFCVSILILLVMASASLAQEGTWTNKADMPTARYWLSTCAINGNIYAVGGFTAGILFNVGLEFQRELNMGGVISPDLLKSFERYGISVSENATISVVAANKRWQVTDDDNEWHYSIYKVGDRLNVCSKNCDLRSAGASRAPLDRLEKYDPGMDIWMEKADMPTPRGLLSASVVNDKLYAVGGSLGDPRARAEILSTVEEYDPVTDSWTRRADMPTARSGLSTSVVNGRIYAIGGTVPGSPVSTVEEYNPVTDAWTKKSDMLIARWQHSTSVVDGKIYVIGGSTITGGGPAGELTAVEEYDPLTDTWTMKADMPTARRALPTNVDEVNGQIYIIGGFDGYFQLSTSEVYDPVTDKWARLPNMPEIRDSPSTCAVNGGIYVLGGTIFEQPISTVEMYDTGVGIRVKIISPQQSPIAGGGSITIFGNGFLPGTGVTIGSETLIDLAGSDTLISGIIPSGTEGERQIWLDIPGLGYPFSAGEFHYYNPDSSVPIVKIVPGNGGQAGGHTGSVTGSEFLAGAKVMIGDVLATNVVVTPTLITFKIPPGSKGAKDVVVLNTDGRKGILRQAYTYNPFPVIENIQPNEGSLAGNTEISISGEHFMQGVTVAIGEEMFQRLSFFSATELRLKTPPGEAGIKAVTVINLDGQKAILEEGFTYNPAPTITSIEPDAGSMEGGTVITITGTGFIGLGVLIGGAEASPMGSSSSTKIRAETPPSDAGVKDVVVRNRDGQKATLEDAFTYNLAPVITKVIPDNGKLAGGTSIILQGSGFLPDAKVFILTDGGTSLTAPSVQIVSSTIITAITPPGKPGPKDVAVRNADEQRIILEDGFTYNPLPTITHITPNNGGSSGGTKIIIEGTGFLQGVRVAVGGNAGTAQLQDENTIQVITPSNPPGIWDVRVLNPDTQEVTAKKAFITVGEIVYNFPNPFRASRGTTFRYMTRHQVQYMTIKIFNLSGSPVDVVETTGSNEVKWFNSKVHIGLYVYLVEAELENGERRQFRSMLEVYR